MAVSDSPSERPSMPDAAGPDARETDESAERAREAARRRRLAIALGGSLPEGTSDERAEGWGERADGSDDDRLRREVPPHHG
jgi:hypothetical protein